MQKKKNTIIVRNVVCHLPDKRLKAINSCKIFFGYFDRYFLILNFELIRNLAIYTSLSSLNVKNAPCRRTSICEVKFKATSFTSYDFEFIPKATKIIITQS